MTAMSLTLQANDELNKNLSNNESTQNFQNSTIIDYNTDLNTNPYQASKESDNSVFGSSGSFGCDVGASGTAFCNAVSFQDNDVSGTITEGDVLHHIVQFRNESGFNASGIIIDDVMDSNITLINGSVNVSQGVINTGASVGDSAINISLGMLAPNDIISLNFSATVNPIADGNIIEISNQGLVTTNNIGTFISDDPSTAELHDPTVVQAYGVTTVAYSEFATDDFSDHLTPTAVTFSSEHQQILGNVGGVGVDSEDCFQFDIPSYTVLNSIVLADYQITGANVSTQFHVFTGMPPSTNPIGDIAAVDFTQNDIGNNLVAQDITSGSYTVCLFEGTVDQTYILEFTSTITEVVYKDDFEN